MRKVVQPAVVKVVIPEIVEFTCDYCHGLVGTTNNPMETWRSEGRDYHYCKRLHHARLAALRRPEGAMPDESAPDTAPALSYPRGR